MADITSYRKDTEKNILASPPTADGELAFATDTYKFFISVGDHWSIYYNSKNFGKYTLTDGYDLNYKPIYHLDASDNLFLRNSAGTIPSHLDSVTKIICKSTNKEITGASSTAPKYITQPGVPTVGGQLHSPYQDLSSYASSDIYTDRFFNSYWFRIDYYYEIKALDSNVSFEKLGANKNEIGHRFWMSGPLGTNTYMRNNINFGDISIKDMLKDSRYIIKDTSYDFTLIGAEINSVGAEFIYNGNDLAPKHELQNLTEGDTYQILEKNTEFDYTVIGSSDNNHGTQFVYNGEAIISTALETLVSEPIPEILVTEKDFAGDGIVNAFFATSYVMPKFEPAMKEIDDQSDARIGQMPTLQFSTGQSLEYDIYAHNQKYSGFGFTTFLVLRINYDILRKYVQVHSNTHLYNSYNYSWRGIFSGGNLGSVAHGATAYPDQRFYVDWMSTATDYGANGPAYGIPFIMCMRSENSESGSSAYGLDWQGPRGGGVSGLNNTSTIGYHSRSVTTGLYYETFYGGLMLNKSKRNGSRAGMEFAELIAFDNYLNETECDIVGKYLSNKWKTPWQVISPIGDDYRQVLNPFPEITTPSKSVKELYPNQ